MTTRQQSKRQQEARQNREHVEALARQGYKAPDIATRLGLGLSTVYSFMPKETKLVRGLTSEDRSLRQTVLDLVDAKGEYPTSQNLLRDLGALPRWARLDLHSLNHQLRQMAKQGQITLKVRSRGNVADLERIARKGAMPAGKLVDAYPDGSIVVQNVATPKLTAVPDVMPGIDARAREQQRYGERPPGTENFVVRDGYLVPPVTTGAERTQTRGRVEADASDAWPILASLRRRWAEQSERRRQADALLAAAEMLADVDHVESERLLARAADVGVLLLSDVEREYLYFADGLVDDTRQALDSDASVVESSVDDE